MGAGFGAAAGSAPAGDFLAITTSDTDNFPGGECRSIYVGGAGNIVAVKTNGTTVTFVGLQAGTILPIFAVRVNATNTTATNLVALY